jgi:hypothetical protein
MLHNAADEVQKFKKVGDFVEYAKFTWLGLAYSLDKIWRDHSIEDLHRQGKIPRDVTRLVQARKTPSHVGRPREG